MKKLFFLLVFSLIVVTGYSQEQNQSLYFKAGISFPLFDLANGNSADTTAGMAAKGLHVEVGYNFPISANLGLGLAAEYYGNQYSQSKFHKYYGQLLSDASYGIQTSYPWSVGGLVLRPSYRIPFSKNVSWQIYASGGFLAFFTPEFVLTTTSMLNSSHATYKQLRSKGFSFTYGLGSRLNFKFHKTHLFVDADFLASKIKYTATGTDWNDKAFSYPIQQMLGYLSVNLGYTIYL